jgi:polyisoprenoid-binding protein YceI
VTTSTQTRGLTGTWTIDPTHSLVEFSGKHMMFTTVKGRFRDLAGTITLDEADLARSGVEVEIQAASIDSGVEQRDGHLRSADFLDAETYPTITFKSRRIDGTRDEFKLIGDLTVRGETREVALDVTLNGIGQSPFGTTVAGFSASTKLNRKDFGLNWNVALEAGGVLVGDQIKIDIELEAVKQEA